jgi:hypothetical protein
VSWVRPCRISWTCETAVILLARILGLRGRKLKKTNLDHGDSVSGTRPDATVDLRILQSYRYILVVERIVLRRREEARNSDCVLPTLAAGRLEDAEVNNRQLKKRRRRGRV